MAMWRSLAIFSTSRCCVLLGRLIGRHRQRLGSRPAMLGYVEENAFWTVELLFEVAGLMPALTLVDVVLGAEALELFGELIDILDQYTEMVNAAKIHPFAELVGLEFENGHVERAVA